MRRAKAIFTYSIIGFVILLLVSTVLTARFLFHNEAPLTSGDVERGIKYKNDLQLDLYLPTKKVFTSSPVVVYIHGGAWIGGTRAAINFNRFNGAVKTLRENGYTIVAPDYSLAGKNKSVFPDCILDIYEAIEWTKKNASTYGMDTTNMGILGESAGAHIGMMIAFPETTLQPERYTKTKFNYVIDVYGPNNLRDIYDGRAVERIDASLQKISRIFGSEFNIKEYVFGFDPSKDSARATELLYKFSPANLVRENKTPVLIIHGKKDQLVPVEQSMKLKSKLDSLGEASEIHLIDGVDHNFINASHSQKDSLQVWISDFVIRTYKK
jgi:acetyl esterase/lipase